MRKHRLIYPLVFIPILLCSLPLAAQPAVVSSINPEDLAEYEQQSPVVKKIIEQSLKLTDMDLAYTFGSATPSKGGMDCSGAIFHLLKSMSFNSVPRTSYTMYHWANDHGNLTKFKDVHTPTHSVFKGMKPGDMVFWEGTYSVKERTPPITHVMLYLGTLKKDGQGVLFGASSGRRFRGKKIHGVSVFDFKVPATTSKARMVAFGPIPGIREIQAAATIEAPAPPPPKKKLGLFKKKSTPPPAPPEPAPSTQVAQDTPPQVPSTSPTTTNPSQPQQPASTSPNVAKSLADKLKQMKGNNKPFKNLFKKKPNLLNRKND